MTVINMLAVKDGGIAVADEQSSTPSRKYNVAQKLRMVTSGVVYGGSGNSDALSEIYETVREMFASREKEQTRPVTARTSAEAVKETIIDYLAKTRDDVLRANVGITYDELKTGTHLSTGKPLSPETKNLAGNVLGQVNEGSTMQVLIGGMNGKSFGMFYVDNNGFCRKISRPYASVGSGSDESDKVLSGFTDRLSRDKRQTIPNGTGMVKILEATNASSRINQGVGGTPSIVYFAEGKIYNPSESACVLACEMVEGATSDLLDRSFVEDSIMQLVTEKADLDELEERMRKQAKDWKNLERRLRGYRD